MTDVPPLSPALLQFTLPLTLGNQGSGSDPFENSPSPAKSFDSLSLCGWIIGSKTDPCIPVIELGHIGHYGR